VGDHSEDESSPTDEFEEDEASDEEWEEDIYQGPNTEPAEEFTVFIYLTFNNKFLDLSLKYIF